jgi:hypothetical protein
MAPIMPVDGHLNITSEQRTTSSETKPWPRIVVSPEGQWSANPCLVSCQSGLKLYV